MNRRGFLSAMLKAGAGAMILPGAVTYTRIWKAVPGYSILTYQQFQDEFDRRMFSERSKAIENMRDFWKRTIKTSCIAYGIPFDTVMNGANATLNPLYEKSKI